VGDIVTLWGDSTSPSAEEWATWAGTIGDEVVSGIASGVERRFSS
jgi:alanine racemase